MKVESVCFESEGARLAVALYMAQRDKRVKGIVLWATPHDYAYNVKKFITRTRGRFSYYFFLLISYVDAVANVSRLFNTTTCKLKGWVVGSLAK